MPDHVPFPPVLPLAFLLAFVVATLPARGQSSSENFTLEVQRVGAGGGSASSASYADDATAGQAAIGPSTSASYRSGSGFTYPLDPDNEPLPVELASFKATRAGDGIVRLTWQTASETNNAGFRVEHRRPEAGAWTQVGFVESKASGGTTTEAQTYRYAATDLSVGTHRFRLKQVDLSGATHLHDPVTIKLQMQEALRLSAPVPNPASGTATLRFAVKEQAEARMTLYNTLGQRVRVLYRGTPAAGESQRVRLEARSLPSGVYLLRLRADGQAKTRRMTVVR
jgi:hypothetical protein